MIAISFSYGYSCSVHRYAWRQLPGLVASYGSCHVRVINFGSIEPGLVIIKRKPGDNDCVHAQRFRPAHLATRGLDRWQAAAGLFIAVCVHLRDKARIGGTSATEGG
jgi:hypothetical protein